MRARAANRNDEKDRAILRLLQEDARITNKDLAEAVGLAETTCLERVRKLERSGIICGYHAHVSPDFSARRFQVWANIVVLDLPQATQDAVQKLIKACSHIVAAFQLSGAFDCVVHFASEEALAWRLFCGELMTIGVGPDRVTFGLIVGAQNPLPSR